LKRFNEYMLSDIYDSNRAKYLMTNWLRTDRLGLELFVKFLIEVLEALVLMGLVF